MDREFLITIGSRGQLALTVWLRGVEVKVKGYVEPADRRVGIMQESLVIEELRPLTPNSRWREPDIDDLLDTGEYFGIETAFWDTWRAASDSEYLVYNSFWYENDETEDLIHEEWHDYWLGAGDQP